VRPQAPLALQVCPGLPAERQPAAPASGRQDADVGKSAAPEQFQELVLPAARLVLADGVLPLQAQQAAQDGVPALKAAAQVGSPVPGEKMVPAAAAAVAASVAAPEPPARPLDEVPRLPESVAAAASRGLHA